MTINLEAKNKGKRDARTLVSEITLLMRQLRASGELLDHSGYAAESDYRICPAWPDSALAIRIDDKGEPRLKTVHLLEGGSYPRWYDPCRPDIRCPDALGLIGFWDSSFSYDEDFGEALAEVGWDGDILTEDPDDDTEARATRVARTWALEVGAFVTFTGTGWVSDIDDYHLLNRIDEVIDQLSAAAVDDSDALEDVTSAD